MALGRFSHLVGLVDALLARSSISVQNIFRFYCVTLAIFAPTMHHLFHFYALNLLNVAHIYVYRTTCAVIFERMTQSSLFIICVRADTMDLGAWTEWSHCLVEPSNWWRYFVSLRHMSGFGYNCPFKAWQRIFNSNYKDIRNARRAHQTSVENTPNHKHVWAQRNHKK